MSYDAAGNLTADTYSGTAVTRVYDAENKMTSETTYNSVVAGSYSYDGVGRRVKRIVGGVETWQVSGGDGQIIAEYAANGAPSSPQKEYGYRNGELLITATVTTGSGGSAFSFTDDPVVAETTTVRAVHLTELRAAVNQARARANLSSATWTDDPVQATVTAIKAVHITELRARLDEARTALGLSTGGYTDPALASGYDIRAAHISELRTKTNEALTSGGTGNLDIRWLVSDQLGTPRMVFDQTGSLANVSRHDYLPFGEELFAGTGGRTTAQGYTAAEGVRQKFTLKERDNETGLDYFLARYYSSTQGRFTSPDEFSGGPDEYYDFKDLAAENPTFYADLTDPQSLNKYQYAYNNPLLYIDPDGHQGVREYARRVFNDATTVVKGAVDTQIAVDKVGANIVIGAANIGNAAIGGQQIAPFEPSGKVQEISMHALEVGTLVSPLAGKGGPANVVVAESKQTTIVAAEAANARTAGTAATSQAKQGIYEFPDKASPGRTYVGQSGNIPRRLGQHVAGGRLGPGSSATTTPVAGGRVAREVAEQRRINQLGGTRNNPGSRTSNIRNPVSRQRQRKLDEQQ